MARSNAWMARSGWLSVGDSAARKPAKGGIGVEHQTPFDDARSGSMLAAKERNDVASYPKSLRVIFARLDRRSGQAQCFRDFCIRNVPPTL